jgi:GDPmannose 4,6-dehydratase
MRALVTGCTGMDGFHLAELLTGQGDEVFGLVRGQRPVEIDGLTVVRGDLLDQSSLCRAVAETHPDVVYNLAALTSIGAAWGQPEVMSNITGLGVLRLLEAIRMVDPGIRFVQASSADMFGIALESPQTETTEFRPVSPYGAAKLFAHQMVACYREAYGIHASNMIMFNHSSSRHGEEFVVRRVCRAAARIATGASGPLRLGSLDAWRDWGYAPDFMRAWPLAAGATLPDDYVLATGELHSLAELCDVAFATVGLDWREHTETGADLGRPRDVRERVGDASKAEKVLGWRAEVDFVTMVEKIAHHDLEAP